MSPVIPTPPPRKMLCPRDHVKDIRRPNGIWWCSICEDAHTTKRSAKYLVPGYRDKKCPICSRGYYVSVSIHAMKKHGVRLEGGHPKSPFTPEEIDARFGHDRQVIRRRHGQWVKAIEEEHAKGGAYIKRLAQRWRIDRSTASHRIETMRRLGLWVRVPIRGASLPGERRRANACERGHRKTATHGYLDDRGHWICRTCVRARQTAARRAAGLSHKGSPCPPRCVCRRHATRRV